LVRVLSAEKRLVPAAAELLGYYKLAPAPSQKQQDDPAGPIRTIESSLYSQAGPSLVATGDWPAKQTLVPFWMPLKLRIRERLTEDPPVEDARLIWRQQEQVPAPRRIPIAPWQTIIPRLRPAISRTTRSLRPDVEKVVRLLATGQFLDHVPRQSVRRWGDGVQLILDRSQHLIPFLEDQRYFQQQLQKLLPHGAVQLAVYDELLDSLRSIVPGRGLGEYRLPEPHVPIVVLGDLGALLPGRGSKVWLDWADQLTRQGGQALVVVPCSPQRVSAALRSKLDIIPWQKLALAQSCESPAARRELVDRLFRLLSPFRRIEPGLLRAVRKMVESAADASLESDFWQDARLLSKHHRAATPDPEQMSGFATVSAEERRQVLEIVRSWRRELAPEVWISEIWGLDADSEALLPRVDAEDARRWQSVLASQVAGLRDDSLLDWLARTTAILPEQALARHQPLRRLHRQVHHHQRLLEGDPRELPAGPVRDLQLCQQHGWLTFREKESSGLARPFEQEHWLCDVRSSNDTLVVWADDDRPEPRFWKTGTPPAWARRWGTDQCGPWSEIAVPDGKRGEVVQRLRWIPAGQFRMGSPVTESERFSDEGPQHVVTISQGYWMFDTAVTQELWRAVIGKNPSRFSGDRLPVERVTWHDCQQFVTQLSKLVPDSSFALPTEAQWEYACRAGTVTPFSYGNQITPEQVNYDGNYPYSNGSKGLYRQKTVPVGSLPANPWGLFEMHGNVREWCMDGQRRYDDQPITDPVGPMAPGADRLIRGGSWYDNARHARSASRFAIDPGDRDGSLGFRCVRVQDQGVAEPAEREALRRGSVAEQRPDEKTRSDVRRITIQLGDSPICEIPKAPRLRVETDLLEVELERFIQPTWATAIGRDRLGLWSEFAVELEGGAVVVQRLRWIPPGRFRMGDDDPESSPVVNAAPQHEVTITDGFWMFDTPVTQALWSTVRDHNPSQFPGGQRPVENVSWQESQEFMQRLSARVPGLNLRLPTEAQWEYACLAGSQTRWSWGDRPTQGVAHVESRNVDAGTCAVGTFAANSWGLFDMHGNVWEWCQDRPREYGVEPVVNPVGPSDGDGERVIRGGGWRAKMRNSQSAARDKAFPVTRSNLIGFRCIHVPTVPSQP
jgi:formylglycine-generating enzyme required for sulfatase activity